MIQRADTVGVFQIEIRAQMSMLPRLKPRVLLRPRDRGRDRAPRPDPGRHGASLPAPAAGHWSRSTYPSEAVKRGARAHARRADLPGAGDAARDRRGRLHAGRGRPAAPRHGGVAAQGRPRAVRAAARRRHARARLRRRSSPSRSSSRSRASASTAFPESHAARSRCSSTSPRWLKRHEPAAFPARCSTRSRWASTRPRSSCRTRAGTASRCAPVDVTVSDWDCTLEKPSGRRHERREPALRLGLRLVAGSREAGAQRIVGARATAPFASVADLARRAELDRRDLAPPRRAPTRSRRSPAIAAHARVGRRRRRARCRRCSPTRTFDGGRARDCRRRPKARTSSPTTARLGLTLRRHPLALLRGKLRQRRGCRPRAEIAQTPHGRLVRAARHRHRPPAPGHRERRDLRHARGRDRHRQRDRLARSGRPPAPRAARRATARGLRQGGARGRGRARARRTARGPHAACSGALQTRSRDFH